MALGPRPASADGYLGGSAACRRALVLWRSRLLAVLAATLPCCSLPPRRGVCDTAAPHHALHLPPSAASRRLAPHRRRPRSPSVALPRVAAAVPPPSSATLFRRPCYARHLPHAVASLTVEPPRGALLYPPTRRVASVLFFLRAWTMFGAVSWPLRGGVRRRRPPSGRGGGGKAHPDRLSSSPPTAPSSSSSPEASAPKRRFLSLPSCLLALAVAVLPPPLAELHEPNRAGMGVSYPAANGGRQVAAGVGGAGRLAARRRRVVRAGGGRG